MSTVFLRISSDRAEQLRGIASARGRTITSLIDTLTIENIVMGYIPDQTPGIEYEPVDGDLAMIINGKLLEPLSLSEARDLADMLDDPGRCIGLFTSDEAMAVEVRKAGRGGVLLTATLSSSGEKVQRVFTRSVARDVARQIRNAVGRMR